MRRLSTSVETVARCPISTLVVPRPGGAYEGKIAANHHLLSQDDLAKIQFLLSASYFLTLAREGVELGFVGASAVALSNTAVVAGVIAAPVAAVELYRLEQRTSASRAIALIRDASLGHGPALERAYRQARFFGYRDSLSKFAADIANGNAMQAFCSDPRHPYNRADISDWAMVRSKAEEEARRKDLADSAHAERVDPPSRADAVKGLN